MSEVLPMLLQQEANKLYPDIKNCDITHPPMYPGRVSHNFLLKKRSGIGLNVDFWGDDVLDFIKFESNDYAIVKDSTNIKIKKTNSATTLATQTYNSIAFHSFKVVSGAKGTLAESGTSITGSVVWGSYLLTDWTKTWAANAYAWKYVYIYEGTGAGQTFYILANTATALTVQNGWLTLPSTAKYKIFETYWEILSFVWGDNVYLMHNDTAAWITGFPWIATWVIDFAYVKQRYFILLDNYQVVTGWQTWVAWTGNGSWYYSTWLSSDSVLGASQGSYRVLQFNDYVLIIWPGRVQMVKETSVSVSWDSYVFHVLYTVSDFVWILTPWCVIAYNWGLYMITWDKKFISFSITSVWVDKFNVAIEDIWQYIQQYLDWFSSSDDISIGILPDEIIITNYNNLESNLFKFNQYYKTWHQRTTELIIKWLKIYTVPYYIWDHVYTYNTNLTQDYGLVDFNQYIRVIAGEEDLFSLKTYIYNKIYLTKNTNRTSTITYRMTAWGVNYTEKTDLTQYTYLSDAALLKTNSTLGSTIMWFGTYGGSNNTWYISSQVISNLDVLEIPLNFSCLMMEIILEGEREFGGVMVGYDKLDPYISPIESVLGITI